MSAAAILGMRNLGERMRKSPEHNMQQEEPYKDVITQFAEGTRLSNPDFVAMFPEADAQQVAQYTDFTQQFADGLNLIAQSHGTMPEDIILVKNEAPYVDVDIKTGNIILSTGHITRAMSQEQVSDPLLSGEVFTPLEGAFLTGVKAGAHLEFALSQPDLYAATIDHPHSIIHLDNPLEAKVSEIVSEVATRLHTPQTTIDAQEVAVHMQPVPSKTTSVSAL